jgi:hypothetical protein
MSFTYLETFAILSSLSPKRVYDTIQQTLSQTLLKNARLAS